MLHDDMTEYIKYCKEQCMKNMTIEDVLRDTKQGNFCDVSYFLLDELERKKEHEEPIFAIAKLHQIVGYLKLLRELEENIKQEK